MYVPNCYMYIYSHIQINKIVICLYLLDTYIIGTQLLELYLKIIIFVSCYTIVNALMSEQQ